LEVTGLISGYRAMREDARLMVHCECAKDWDATSVGNHRRAQAIAHHWLGKDLATTQ